MVKRHWHERMEKILPKLELAVILMYFNIFGKGLSVLCRHPVVIPFSNFFCNKMTSAASFTHLTAYLQIFQRLLQQVQEYLLNRRLQESNGMTIILHYKYQTNFMSRCKLCKNMCLFHCLSKLTVWHLIQLDSC